MTRRQRVWIACAVLATLLGQTPSLHADGTLRPFGLRAVSLPPAPEPFSLDAYAAVQAVWMLRRSGFLQRYEADGRPQTVTVRSVRVVTIERDSDPAPPDRSRYDILLNGERLDWDSLYIEYDGRMVNLRLLFTYRNQRPVPDGPYRIPEHR